MACCRASRKWLWLALPVILGLEARSARADFLIYNLGGGSARSATSSSELKIVLQGKVVVNQGRTMTYTHPTLKEKLHFSLDDATRGQLDWFKAPTSAEEFQKRVNLAGKDPEQLMKAAVWALKKGLPKDSFYNTIEKVLAIDPSHSAARQVMELRQKMDEPLEDNPALEKELRSIVQLPSMKIEKSKHFILLHDTDPKPEPGRKKNRANERLDLLEQVYETFLQLFYSQDIELDIPKERMKVVLFKDERDFDEFKINLSPSLAGASGFWESIRNVSFFYDHGSSKIFKGLKEVQEELGKEAKQAQKDRSNPGLVRFVKLIDLLLEIEQENLDITVVSHEATHQMAGNTGLMPRHVQVPSWVHEGLATYFEAPSGAVWAGIGAVNEERLEYYRALANNDRVHSNIDFIVGDQIFDYAASHGAKLHGYAQAWAITHFLLENHTKDFVTYYRMLGDMPPDASLSPELLVQLFNRVFGENHKALDLQWRSYMRGLKTDLERLEEADKERDREKERRRKK
jgi:Protein of unknown function (DUF1570)